MFDWREVMLPQWPLPSLHSSLGCSPDEDQLKLLIMTSVDGIVIQKVKRKLFGDGFAFVKMAYVEGTDEFNLGRLNPVFAMA